LLATFDQLGYYSWSVPAGVTTVTFDVYGAAGGNATNGPVLLAKGGPGGEARAQFRVTPGEAFEIDVGGRGNDNDGSLGAWGGFNGGGHGGDGSGPVLGGAGGGGGTDVRLGGVGNACGAPRTCQQYVDIVAAGGGGGAGAGAFTGGAGGGVTGANGQGHGGFDGSGGQQYGSDCSSGGESFCFFWGGVSTAAGGGGGGGGWFGGQGAVGSGDSAGGGSGYISPFTLKGSFPGGTRGGDGLVRIRTP
jgi:hypothetical protein